MKTWATAAVAAAHSEPGLCQLRASDIGSLTGDFLPGLPVQDSDSERASLKHRDMKPSNGPAARPCRGSLKH